MPVVGVTSLEQQGPAGARSYRHLEQGAPVKVQTPAEEAATPQAPTRGLKPDFLDMVKGFVGDVNDIQLQSGRTIDAFAAGEITDVHQVMVAVQEAGLALDLLLEIRNRTMEAFQEIMRMQV